jgi:prepilin-type processing-associated H-X9-DG protein
VKAPHLETINSLFLDSHVKAMQRNTILGPGKAQWRFWTTSAD